MRPTEYRHLITYVFRQEPRQPPPDPESRSDGADCGAKAKRESVLVYKIQWKSRVGQTNSREGKEIYS